MNRANRAKYPWWVKLSILGVPGRSGLWACVMISLALGVAGLVCGLQNARYLPGALFTLAAIPYWQSIRWIDTHGSWDEEPK